MEDYGKRLYPKQTDKVILAKEFLRLVKEGKIIWIKPKIDKIKYNKYE